MLDIKRKICYNTACKVFCFTPIFALSGLIFLKNLNFGYLLDFYGKVLPDRTAQMLDLYYNEDLSLAEIADNFGITRQGVRDAIKRGEDELTKLEENLKLTEKIERLNFETEKLKKIAQDKNYTDILEISNRLSEILYL